MPTASIAPSTIQVEDHLSRTAAQYASQRSNGESLKAHQPPASSLGIYDHKNSTMTGAPLQHLFATSTLDTPQLFSSTLGAPVEEEYATFNESILKQQQPSLRASVVIPEKTGSLISNQLL